MLGDGWYSLKGRVVILKISGLSGAPCGTPADGEKEGPMYEWVLIRILRFWRKLVRILMKRGSRGGSI